MRFLLDHFTMVIGTLCVLWAIFQLGRLWEREHSMWVFSDEAIDRIRRDLQDEESRIQDTIARGPYDYTNE